LKAQQQNAAPLKDDKGNVVNGASGKPALVPGNFDTKKVLKAGKMDAALSVVNPVLGAAATAADLAKFRRGGSWDIQRLGGSFDPRYIDGATILIGAFAASANIDKNAILSVENSYAKPSDHPGAAMDPTYTNLPARNVQNTSIGMELVNSGSLAP
jgi:hypothetical protein